MAKKHPVTPAIRMLRAAGVNHGEYRYDYDVGGGAAGAAGQLGLEPSRVVKTLILETSKGNLVCLLMHGDREVSLKQLARVLGVKSVQMASPKIAEQTTGYQVGGTSPFGLRQPLPIYCEATIADYESIVINGGKRGFLIEVAYADAAALLNPRLVTVAI